MPLWTIHHTPGVFTDADKHRLAARITDHYVSAGLPRFYVMVVYHQTRPEDLYVGGEPAGSAVRIVIDHIARHSTGSAHRQRITQWIDDILDPYLNRDGLHWEFHADETSEELWMINGFVPPPGGSDAEKYWAAANSTSPY